MTCSKCRFFEPTQNECRINPPTRVSDGYGIHHGFPRAKPFQACGHFAHGNSVVADAVDAEVAVKITKHIQRSRPGALDFA